MSDQIPRREALQKLGITGAAGLLTLAENAQAQTPPNRTITTANCRDVVLTEGQAKALLNRKLDDFMDDPNVRKILDEKFNVGKFKIFWAHGLADIQVRNTFKDIEKVNPWDKAEDGKPPRSITWNVAVKYYKARLGRFAHEKLAPKYAEVMKKYKGALPSEEKEFYDYVAKMVGYSTIEDFLGYKKDNDDWQKTPLYARPPVNYDNAIRVFNPKRSPFDMSVEDLKSVNVNTICTIAAASHAGEEVAGGIDWQERARKPLGADNNVEKL